MAIVQKYRINDVACALSHYPSVADMEHDCVTRALSLTGNRDKRSEINTHPGGLSWYGVQSLAEVKRILREGYLEGAAKVDSLYDLIAPTLPRAIDFRRQRVRSDQGDDLDIHAVNRGALDKAWITTKRKVRLGSGVIRIAVDICGNANVQADQLQWRGIAALTLSRALTKAGYSVEIVAGQSGTNAFQENRALRGTITCIVKPRNAAVDTATLAATVCLPGFFRYLGCASIVRQADALNMEVCDGLGRSVKLETVLPVPEKISQIVVSETVNSRETAQAWIKESLILLQGSTMTKERTSR